jgi:hypothetical protein
MRNFIRNVLLFLGLLYFMPSNPALCIPITDPLDSALAGGSVIDFGSQAVGTYDSLAIDTVTFTADDKTFQIGSTYSGSYNTSGQYLGNTTTGFSAITFSFSSTVDAFGFNWGGSDTTWTLTAYDPSDNPLESYNIPAVGSSNSGDFFGLAVNDIAYATLGQNGSWSQLSFLGLASLGLNLNDEIFIDNFSYANDALPTPEPATMLLFGSGLIGLGAVRRKFTRKQSDPTT